MPELPEVETVARQLHPLIAGRRVKSLRIHDPLLGSIPVGKVRGSRVAAVARLGKQVVISLERNTRTDSRLWLAVHLRMTGRLIWRPGRTPVGETRHLRAALALDGGVVDFVDPRRFGVIRLTGTGAEIAPPGADPVSDGFTPGLLRRLIGGSRQEIKVWLLRQDRITGLGNIYASEILFRSRIHPERPADTLDRNELRRLHAATGSILRRAIRHCGTTFSDFQDATGETGAFQQFLQVYGHAGEPCRRCGTIVERKVQQGRSTFFCPACQPAAGAVKG
jgi:formamidopyrimidine-DNA glycosylase